MVEFRFKFRSRSTNRVNVDDYVNVKVNVDRRPLITLPG